MVQWCFPSRRQQAGRFESGSEANAGTIGEKPNNASSRMAVMRRKPDITVRAGNPERFAQPSL
jgi:hypothetical protein